MKLTYWVAECLDDAKCYNIRARTKKEVVASLKDYEPNDFSKPFKMTIEYNNAFDLMRQCMNEGSLDETQTEVSRHF